MVSFNSLNNVGYRTATPSAIPQYKSQTQKSQQNLIGSSGNQVFRLRLEKHLDDVKKGKGYLESQIGKGLQVRHNDNGTTLNEFDPKSGRSYSGFYTALNYKERARYSTGINDATKLVKDVKRAIENQSEFEKQVEALVALATKEKEVTSGSVTDVVA
jgi:hypothetical protein